MHYKALSEIFFENNNDDKVFLRIDNENITYGKAKENIMRIISYILVNNLLDRNFYIKASFADVIITSFLAINYINKDAYIISDNNEVLIEKNKDENVFYITDDNYFKLLSNNPDLILCEKFLATLVEKNGRLIQFTSGTTGKPSQVIRTKESCLLEGNDLIKVWEINQNSKIACFTPFSYSFVFGDVVFTTIMASASIITCKKFNIKNVSSLLQNNMCTHFVTVVSVIKLLLIQKNKEKLRFLDYIICSGSKLSKKDERNFYKKYGIHVSEQYGMTETGALLYSYISGEFFERCFPSVSCRIDDSILFVNRNYPNSVEIKTNDYAIAGTKGIKIVGRADSVLKINEKRFSITYIEKLFEDEDYITIGKKLLSNQRILLHYKKEDKKIVKNVVFRLKQLAPSLKIKIKEVK